MIVEPQWYYFTHSWSQNSGLPEHYQTLYPLDQWAGHTYVMLYKWVDNQEID